MTIAPAALASRSAARLLHHALRSVQIGVDDGIPSSLSGEKSIAACGLPAGIFHHRWHERLFVGSPQGAATLHLMNALHVRDIADAVCYLAGPVRCSDLRCRVPAMAAPDLGRSVDYPAA